MSNDNYEAKFGDLDALFGASLDDIADLPSYETPSKGAYIFSVTTNTKEIGGKPAVEAEYTVVETVELETGETKVAAVGTKFSTAFILGNSISEGKLKEFLTPFGAHFGTGSIGELVRDHIKDVIISATLKHRIDKTDKEKIYPDVKNITIA